MADKEKSILVVAINLCTSSFGYAYSFKEDYKRNPTEVSLNQNDLTLPRFPISMLLNPEKKFIASGDRAEGIFSNLDQHNKCCHYYFSAVKLNLQDTIKLSKDTMIADDEGKEILALDIFAHFITSLKDHLLSFMETKGLPVYIEDIYWVLPMPVPLILDISSIQFMTEAANKAGILTEQLTICSEQEVVSMYCQHEPATNLKGNPCTKPILSFRPGTKYMYIVIDLEGIPADIYCYQKQSDGTLKEFHRPKGGIRKGSKVNEAFDRIMIKIFGNECFRSFKERYEEDCSYMYWEFAKKTMMVNIEEKTDQVRITLPPGFFEILEEYGGTDILDKSKYAQKVFLKRDRLTMKTDVFLHFFRNPTSMTLEQLRVLMMKDNFSDISLITGVGAFSKFPLMYEAIRNAFPEKIVIFPEDNGLAILKGAVLFGHTCTPRDVLKA